MVLPYRGSARPPGPFGTTPGRLGRGIPGPLGFRQVDLGTTGATRASRTFTMPPPWHSSTIIRVSVVDWKLSDGLPTTTQVRQGALPNCPIAAVLAALAHTPVGQRYLDGLITEYIGAVVKTTLSGDVMDKLVWEDEDKDDKPQAKQLVSKRYFSVKLKKRVDVHDTFYVKYTDGTDLDLVFMNSPNDVLWPSVIEKACAIHYGNYREMSNYKKHTANELWEVVVGSAPQAFTVEDSTDIEKIRDAARVANSVPTIAASREHVSLGTLTPWHGFAVLGMQGHNIELYDPAKAKPLTLSFEDFRNNFQMILYGSP